jgi:hypothetical protein
MSDVITIQPGAGSFTDTFGNVFTIDAGDNNTADINGQAITLNGESSNTGALQLNNGSVYGQDQNTGQWYLLASKGAPGLWEWQPVSAPTDSGGNFVLSSSDATTAVLGSDQAAMAFVGGGSPDMAAASPSSTSSSPTTSEALTPGDLQQSSGSSLPIDPSLQGLPQAAPDATGGTMLTFGTWHSGDPQGMIAVPASQPA